jgi:hypothetical protein
VPRGFPATQGGADYPDGTPPTGVDRSTDPLLRLTDHYMGMSYVFESPWARAQAEDRELQRDWQEPREQRGTIKVREETYLPAR